MTAQGQGTARRGVFITVEGIDGAGKTTQARMLVRWLREQGQEVLLTREPGGTPLGEQLRKLLLGGAVEVDARAELLLYAADRAQHVAEVILPALSAGQTVVCERFSDSTVAYQGYGRELEPELVSSVTRFAAAGLEPDLTVWLEVAPEVARRRLEETPDRLEREGAAFHRRVAEGYQELARTHRERVRAVDGGAAPEQVFRQVAEVVARFLEERTRKSGSATPDRG